jgi:putative ABC transport system permease protein
MAMGTSMAGADTSEERAVRVEARLARPDPAAGANSTGTRLLRFALANVARRPARFVLSVIGIALAIMAVVVVRTISIGFAGSGSASLSDALRGAPLWVVPAQGVHYDPQVAAILPDGPAAAPKTPEGWVRQRVTAGIWQSPAGPVALYGRSDALAGRAVLGSSAAAVLGVSAGDSVRVGDQNLSVAIVGKGRIVTVPEGVARSVVGTNGWWTVTPSRALAGRLDLGQLLSASSGVPQTSDPAIKPGTGNTKGLIYNTTAGGSVTFQQRFSALFAGKVTGSVLGIVSTVGLAVGFVIAATSFLAAVQERRREFGIMASIGLADEVLYFFLVESGLVFVVAYLAGTLLAGAAVLTLLPDLSSIGDWLQASAMAAAYLPAMAIICALVPVHRLLQQRPVALLADAS